MSLFVGRLPPDFDLSELEELFEKYGKIAECKIKKGNKFGNTNVSVHTQLANAYNCSIWIR